ncbi:hypothetical protein [Kitasatospora sp. NPDC057936]|uniref:hypothetical protein n=1 Tax=Kitasatospora sp. NPDC057936 TaxID=3346283 RepID=UPI0036DA9F57
MVLETSSPDGRTGFLVRKVGVLSPEYSLELVLHGVDAAQPVVTAISYTQVDGRERMLLLPVMQGQFGPPASYVRLPGFGIDVAWTASSPSPATSDTVWDAEVVADSVRLALNEATRDTWRQVRELVDENLRGVIDGALR